MSLRDNKPALSGPIPSGAVRGQAGAIAGGVSQAKPRMIGCRGGCTGVRQVLSWGAAPI